MPVEFSNFPVGWKQPLYWVEIDPSMAGLPTTRLPALVVGQKLAAGKQANNIPVAIGTLAQAGDAFGVGSMLYRMFEIFMKNNFSTEMWGLCVADPQDGSASTGTITVATRPTAAGTIALYIGGQLARVNVAASDSVLQVAAKIATAINAVPSMPVVALMTSADAAVVNLTCKWLGESGDDIDMRDSYRGTIAGEKLPIGCTLTYSNSGKLDGGAGFPEFDDAIAALSDEAYEFVAMPYTDSTSVLAWCDEFGFSDTGRWGWLRQEYGHLFSAYRALYADMRVWGATNNSGNISFMGVEMQSPSPVWEWTAAYCSKAARALANDPARPLQTLELSGILAAPKHSRFSTTERNTLANYGIATQKLGSNGVPMIMRETTAYQLNLYGQGDDAYELVTTLATLAKIIRNQRHAITSKFPRHKLADNDTRFGVGQAIVTCNILKAEMVSQYRIDEFNGLVENVKAFKAHLIVERDPNDPNRVNVLYPPDLINQLRIFATLAQFRLQYDRGVDTAIAA